MYAAHYHLSGPPFQLSPDHRFFFGSRSHQRALAYLTFGLNEREGFIVITGDVGAGKTTLVRHLLSQIDPDRYISASVVTTQLEADDALRMVASAFGLPFEGADKATILRRIETFLIEAMAAGKHVLLIVDEVQNMPFSALEELRMLSNFHQDNRPLFQCFLLGQPQFRRAIAGDDLEQLRQRVIASCHLEPLVEEETREYIVHRLQTVGWADDPSFDEEVFGLIHRYTKGVPRRVNALCSRLLLYGFLEGLHHIDRAALTEVLRELAAERGSFTPNEVAAATAAVAAPPPRPPPSAPPLAPVTAPAAVAAVARPIRPPAAQYEYGGYEQTLGELQERVAALKEGG